MHKIFGRFLRDTAPQFLNFWDKSGTLKFFFGFFGSQSIKLDEKTLFLEFWSILSSRSDFASIQRSNMSKNVKIQEKSVTEAIKKLSSMIVHLCKGY